MIIFLFNDSFAQPDDTLFVAFWNLENLFDVIDDPDKNDEEFTPTGDKEWTSERLDKKLYNHSRVIHSMNNEKGPDLLGVCEVEHKILLDSLIKKFIPEKNYEVAYAESPDNRGIDNGLIYDSKKFKLISISTDTIHLADGYPTRLILGVKLLLNDKDTLNVFINHWPSRRGGEKSETSRFEAAKVVRNKIDVIFNKNFKARIIIIGDFNDEPKDLFILNVLNAHPFSCDSLNSIKNEPQLYNIAYEEYLKGTGSYKYQDDWNLLDQIIVSNSLVDDKGNIKFICGSFQIYNPYLITTHSGKFEGTPFPTYGGSRYLGGYSDHFPVTAQFLFREKAK